MRGDGKGLGTDADRPDPGPQAAEHPAASLVGLVVPVVVWLAGAMVFFRAVWTSGFRHLMGNDGDTRLIAFLCEHWFRVLHGQESWRSMPFFYPVKGLLGWSDAYMLYEVFYTPLRELGCGPLLALQITQILLSLVGFLGFYYLARRWFPSTNWIALMGALAFTFANNLYVHTASTQLSGVYLVPLILLAATKAWDRATDHGPPQRGPAAFWGALAGIGFGLLFFSTYYVAAFTALAVVVAALWFIVLTALSSGPNRDRSVAAVRSLLHDRPAVWPAAAAAVIGLVVALIPVAVTYLPTRSQIGGVSRSVALVYAVGWRSVGNVGSGNFVWSSFIRAIHPSAAAPTYESTYAVTPVLVATVVIGGAWLARRVRVNHPAVVLALTTITLTVLPVKLHGQSLWLLVRLIPGYDAIRAIDRMEIVTGLVATLAVMAVAAEVHRLVVPVKGRHRLNSPALRVRPMRATLPTSRQRAGLALMAAVLGLIVLEQYDTNVVAQVNRPAQNRLMAAVHRAPASCRFFYVTDRAPGYPFFETQIDAMLIADKVGVPTINGYTGYNPKGWNLENVYDAGYVAAVYSWEGEKGLGPGACRLDLAGMTWSPG